MEQVLLTRAQARERLGAGEFAVRQWCAKGLLDEVPAPPAPPGMCQCGCGTPAPRARWADAARGRVRGQPLRFAHGHTTRRRYVTAASVARLAALLAACAAIDAARQQAALLAAAGDLTALREATVILAQRKADLMVLETGA